MPPTPTTASSLPRAHSRLLALALHDTQATGQAQGSRGILIDGIFGLLLEEKVVCRECGMETHKVPRHYEHLIVVNSISLVTAAQAFPDDSMDRLIAFLFEQEQKYCDRDVGGCGAANVSSTVCGVGW